MRHCSPADGLCDTAAKMEGNETSRLPGDDEKEGPGHTSAPPHSQPPKLDQPTAGPGHCLRHRHAPRTVVPNPHHLQPRYPARLRFLLAASQLHTVSPTMKVTFRVRLIRLKPRGLPALVSQAVGSLSDPMLIITAPVGSEAAKVHPRGRTYRPCMPRLPAATGRSPVLTNVRFPRSRRRSRGRRAGTRSIRSSSTLVRRLRNRHTLAVSGEKTNSGQAKS